MKKILYSYAFIKTLSDNNSDYIDSFWPLIIQIFPENKTLALYAVQKICRDEYQIQIPSHPLEFILLRAKKQGYINKNIRDRYSLTKKGIDFKNDLETERKIQRDINSLLEDIRRYFESHNISTTNEELSGLLELMLKRNFEPMIQFFHTKQILSEYDFIFDARENLLISYMIEAEQCKSVFFRTLEQMFLGSLISTLLYSEDPEKSFEMKNNGFSNCTVYLDTNFIFSLLDLHHTTESNQSDKELLQLLKDFNFRIKVFSFTIDELVRVISQYTEGREGYHPDDDNIYSTLKKRGWKKSNVIEFSGDIEKILLGLGIDIENVPNFNLRLFEPKNPTLISSLEEVKDHFSINTIKHDIAAIERIQEIRGKPIRNIKEIQALFLTTDVKLRNFNYNRMGHRDNKTVCEVFLDRLLTTMLWLTNPKITLSLSMIISAHSKGLFKKWRIFDLFFKVAHDMQKDGVVSEEQINALFYNNYITEELGLMDDTTQTTITPDLVFKKIESAKRLKDRMVEEREIEQKEIERYKLESDKIKNSIKICIHLGSVFIRALFVLGIFGVAGWLYLISRNVNYFLIITVIGGFVALIGNLFGPLPPKFENFEESISNKIFDILRQEKS